MTEITMPESIVKLFDQASRLCRNGTIPFKIDEHKKVALIDVSPIKIVIEKNISQDTTQSETFTMSHNCLTLEYKEMRPSTGGNYKREINHQKEHTTSTISTLVAPRILLK